MKKIVVWVAIAVATLLIIQQTDQHPNHEWQTWKHNFHTFFETEADQFFRRFIFEHNLILIQQHNSNPENTYKMGVNKFSIYTESQFQERFLNINRQKIMVDNLEAVIIDWQQKGAVGPVTNQGSFDSAVMYATLGVVQGLGKVSTGVFQQFSRQQMKECVSWSTGSDPTKGYEYYKSHSVCNQKEYPLQPTIGTCQTKKCQFTISDYKIIKTCDDLKTKILQQPIAVTVDATKWSMYAGGIFNNCGTSLNHMILLTAMADEYWKCKNSWGVSWGEKGYIRLAPGNTCGICLYASYPLP